MNNCSFRKHINSISCLFDLHSCYELAGIIFTCKLNKTTSLAVIDNFLLELLESWQNSQWKWEDKVHKKKPWQLELKPFRLLPKNFLHYDVENNQVTMSTWIIMLL